MAGAPDLVALASRLTLACVSKYRTLDLQISRQESDNLDD
jgi:hypothetical protein